MWYNGLKGKRDPNPYWFNIEIFAVIASNTLKIRQVFSAAFSLYRQKSLMLNCSHLPMRCFSQDFSAAGCRQADACQIRQAERLQKHPSSGNACSSLVCLCRTLVFAGMAHRILACFFCHRQSCKISCFQGCGAAGQGDFYHFVHTDIHGLHHGAANEHGGCDRTKRNQCRTACDMAANGCDKFCYGSAAADIFGRTDLQTNFQISVQAGVNLCFIKRQFENELPFLKQIYPKSTIGTVSC